MIWALGWMHFKTFGTLTHPKAPSRFGGKRFPTETPPASGLIHMSLMHGAFTYSFTQTCLDKSENLVNSEDLVESLVSLF